MERAAILFDVADNVATITLNRPESLNSFNNDMAADMRWAWETVRDTDDIHCVVLQANGDRAFCTGVDIRSDDLWFMKDNDFNSFDPGETLGPKLQYKVWKPVVTAVHGLCAGGAQYFLNESDIIICSDDAVFFDPHANVGIVERVGTDRDAASRYAARRRAALGAHGQRGTDHGRDRAPPRSRHRGIEPRRAPRPGP